MSSKSDWADLIFTGPPNTHNISITSIPWKKLMIENIMKILECGNISIFADLVRKQSKLDPKLFSMV